MTELRISLDLALPVEFATEASAILARRGRGKTYTASVLAEELHAAGQPFVVLDPVGVWWGLRSSADGQSPGLDVKILGGEHSDVPLGEKDGTVLATFVVDHPAAYVLDLSGFEQKAPQDRFVADFAERLYRYKAAQERRTPLTLIIDEADQFAPQKPSERGGIGPKMLGARESIVRQGRARGLGCVLITQRPAVLNKNVLTQAGALLLLGITGPQDRDAVDDWIKGHAEAEQRKEVIGSLARLDVGEAWVWWPTEDLLQRAQIRPRHTFDSSSTPKAGEKQEAVHFADVDLDALKDALAEQIEKAKAEDPKLLQATIRDLRRELAEARAAQPEPVVETVEVPAVDEDVRRELGDGLALLNRAVETLGGLGDKLRDGLARASAPRTAERPRVRTELRPESPKPQVSAPARRDTRADVPRPATGGGDRGLAPSERKILTALAQYPLGRTKGQVAMLTGYKATGGRFNNLLSSLRSAGYLEGRGDLRISDAGVDALGDYDPLPTGRALGEFWLRELPPSESKVLGVLLDAWPASLSKDDLGAATDYEPSGGRFNNMLSRLRTLELIERGGDVKASDELADG